MLPKRYPKFVPRVLVEIDPQTLVKIGYTNVTQNWFYKRYKRCSKWIHKYYSKLVSQVLLKIDSQMLLKIRSKSVTLNRPTNISQNWLHECFSKLVLQVSFAIDSQTLLRIDPQVLVEKDLQTLVKISFTSVTRTYFHKSY